MYSLAICKCPLTACGSIARNFKNNYDLLYNIETNKSSIYRKSNAILIWRS